MTKKCPGCGKETKSEMLSDMEIIDKATSILEHHGNELLASDIYDALNVSKLSKKKTDKVESEYEILGLAQVILDNNGENLLAEDIQKVLMTEFPYDLYKDHYDINPKKISDLRKADQEDASNFMNYLKHEAETNPILIANEYNADADKIKKMSETELFDIVMKNMNQWWDQ